MTVSSMHRAIAIHLIRILIHEGHNDRYQVIAVHQDKFKTNEISFDAISRK